LTTQISAEALLLQLREDHANYVSYALTLNKKCMEIQTRRVYQTDDIRESIYKQLYKVVWPYSVGLRFLITELFHNARYAFQFPGTSDGTRRETIQYYELLLRNGLIYSTSSIVESGLRSVFRALYPEKPGTDSRFQKTILRPMLKNLEIDTESDQVSALKLLLEVRNCIHNNGVYLGWKREDLRIKYRGDNHTFTYGKSHRSAKREMLLSIIRDIESLFDLIFNKNKLKVLDYVPDVIANNSRDHSEKSPGSVHSS